jgi:plastocyanin
MALLLAFAADCSDSLESSEAVVTDEVAVKDNQFDARVIEVAQGTTVTWTWRATGHTTSRVTAGRPTARRRAPSRRPLRPPEPTTTDARYTVA